MYSAIGTWARYLPKYFTIPLGELTSPEPTLKNNLLSSLYNLETAFLIRKTYFILIIIKKSYKSIKIKTLIIFF